MKANELLLWLSARREGSWQQFRQAVEELHSSNSETASESNDEFPLHQQLRLDLERLAHVEFFAAGCEDGWRIAPATLATHSVSSGVRGVFCGARSPALRQRVISSAEKLKCEILGSLDVPDAIRIVGDDVSALAGLAGQTGLRFQHDAPLAILSHLPPCDPPPAMRSPSEFPQGGDWTIHEFDSTKLAWRKVERYQMPAHPFGMFRFLIHFQRPRYFLRWKDKAFEMPRALAMYALLRRHRREVLRYSRDAAALSVPAICRPPRLLERALVLCSGLPPSYANGELTYSDVPPEVARLAAELLRQPLALASTGAMLSRGLERSVGVDPSGPIILAPTNQSDVKEDGRAHADSGHRGQYRRGRLQTKCPFCPSGYYYEDEREAHMRECPGLTSQREGNRISNWVDIDGRPVYRPL